MRRSVPRFLLAPLLLAAAASASAQPAGSVSLYGLLDLSVGRSQALGGVATKGVDSGKMTTSYWGVKGSEDLGGGMSAVFALESFMRSDTGAPGRFNADTMWARNAYVGLGGKAGQLTLGRNTTSLFVQTLMFNAFGDSFGFSPAIRQYFSSNTVSGDTGWSDSIRYLSPRFGGTSFSLHGALGEANGGRNLGASVNHAAGPLAVAGAWQRVDKGAAVDDTTTWQLAGSYDFGPAKLFGQYGRVKNRTAATTPTFTVTGLGASIAAGSTGKVLVQYGRLSPETGAATTTFTAGYDHFLSKRTDVYAAWMNERRSGTSAANSYGLGVRHRF